MSPTFGFASSHTFCLLPLPVLKKNLFIPQYLSVSVFSPPLCYFRQTGTNIRSHIERKTPIPLGCSHIKLIFHVTSCVILSSINDFNNPNTSVFKFNVFVRRCVSENHFNQGLLSRWYTYVHQHANLEIIHFLNLHRDECKKQQQKQDDDDNIVDIFTFVSTCG